MKILILNGPNLHLLGKRDPRYYGKQTLEELNQRLKDHCNEIGVESVFLQSNHEGTLIDILSQENFDGCVLNAGAFTHYSYALHDTIESISKPVVEVHLSDIEHRDDFRKTRVFADVVKAVFMGEGINSYRKGIDFLKEHFDET